MTVQIYLAKLDFCASYITLKAGRCIACSVLMAALILLLRRTVLKDSTFGRGIIWCLLIPALFVGKLRFFYESRMGVRLFFWWHNISVGIPWVRVVYVTGLLVSGIFFLYRRRKLRCFTRRLRRGELAGNRVLFCDISVSPFATGLFRPRIVVPETLCRELSEEELQMLLLHERTHIRLGHLWIYLLWDILRIVLWPNPLIHFCTRYFRQDMEDICDRITIQRSGGRAREYGGFLLRSLRLQQADLAAAHNSVTLSGGDGYRDIKARLEKVVRFCPYKRVRVVGMCLAAALVLSGLIFGLHRASYPRYSEMEDIALYSMDGRTRLIDSESSPELAEAITIEPERILVDSRTMNRLLEKKHITSQTFVLSFGTFYKVPGVGGGGNAVFIDYGPKLSAPDILEVPYIDAAKSWENWLYRNLL